MKINKTLTALIAGASLGMSGQAMAIGTASNVLITNTATLDFDVSGQPQAQTTDFSQFRVDNRIDLSLSWNDSTAPTTVANTSKSLSFKLYNAGNTAQSYKLSATHETDEGVTIGSDSTDYQTGASPAVSLPLTPGYTYSYYQEDGSNTGFQSGQDTLLVGGMTADIAPATNVASLTDDDQATIVYLVVNNIIGTAFDTDILGFDFTATTHKSGAGIAETNDDTAVDLENVQTVFADANRSGNSTVKSALEILSAKLEMTKEVIVKDDGITGSTNTNFKAIPGATVTYIIKVENKGRVVADLVRVRDDLTAITTLDASAVDTLADLTITGGGNAVSSNSMAASSIDVTLTSLAIDDTVDGSGNDFVQITFDAIIK